jgi:hypothetical protein
MEEKPPVKSKNISDKVSIISKVLPATMLLKIISNISQRVPTAKTMVIIRKTFLNEKGKPLEIKNQPIKRPAEKPPQKCINISKYHTEKYQWNLVAKKLTTKSSIIE